MKATRSGGIQYSIFNSPIGPMLMAMNQRGLCAVLPGDSDEGLIAALQKEFPTAPLWNNPSAMRRSVHKMLVWMAHPRQTDIGALQLDLQGSAFQCRVWREIIRIPYGKRQSYGQIAARIDSSARAVGQACAKNRLALLVPCHRVVSANGGITGYRWGLERKQALLALESSDKK